MILDYVKTLLPINAKVSPSGWHTLNCPMCVHNGQPRPDSRRRGGFNFPNSDSVVFHCFNCGAKLFASNAKFDSGTGWPSFTESLPGAFKTKIDYSFGMKRIEYHCANCGAHHGHIFDDGPGSTGKRFCNNGLSLIFKPES